MRSPLKKLQMPSWRSSSPHCSEPISLGGFLELSAGDGRLMGTFGAWAPTQSGIVTDDFGQESIQSWGARNLKIVRLV